ncbi:MAG: response regulator [Leptolyngbya sp. DLM2.Bin27]|nr:MAG: response regulator [Leptolyngbya sp. DLM2.Bin27]
MQTDAPVNILLVDDQPENLVALEAILDGLEVNLVKSTSGAEALRCLLNDDFAVILLDVQMPQMDGFEVAALIRHRQRSRDTPIIFLTAFSSNEQFMFKGYALGAVDYLIKPIAPNILLSKVAIFIELFKKNEALKQKTEILQQQAAQLEAINAELQASEERFRLLSNCSPVGVFVTDTKGDFVYTNPRFRTICRSAPDCSTDQTWLTCVHADDLDLARSSWSTYMVDGREYAQEFRFVSDDDDTDCWVSVRSARLVSEQKVFLGYVGTIENITERRQAEAANAQVIREQTARQVAETANQMKDEFIAILSHELRTPLNSILGWSHLLRSRNLPPEKIEYALDTIERNANAQKQLIEDILDVSQIVRGQLQLRCQPLDLAAVAQTALETVQPAAEAKAIELVSNLEDSPRLEVMGDLLRLQQVIWNLLTNAIKFTPKQGQVEIQVSVVNQLPQGCQGTAAAYAQLRVADTGLGIDVNFLPHIFDRFRQADSSTTRSQGGLGLGLAIVHYLVQQHQGHVWADSDGLNQGTTFTVALPLLLTDAQTPPPAPPQNTAVWNETYALAGLAILVIDDDADTRDFLRFLLESQGAVVTTAASGQAGLRRLEASQPNLLLCDISMPDMDGYQLMQTIRADLPAPQGQTPAIAITAHARLSDQNQAVAAGFQAHLPKPIEAEMLIRMILQVTGAIAS